MDRERFHVRGDGRINTIVHEVQDYLEVRHWDSPNLTAFANGTYDADRDVLLPWHRQEDRLTFVSRLIVIQTPSAHASWRS